MAGKPMELAQASKSLSSTCRAQTGASTTRTLAAVISAEAATSAGRSLMRMIRMINNKCNNRRRRKWTFQNGLVQTGADTA